MKLTINHGQNTGLDSRTFRAEWEYTSADYARAEIRDRLTDRTIWTASFVPDKNYMDITAPLEERRPYLLTLDFFTKDNAVRGMGCASFSTGLFEGQLSFEYAKWISAYEKDEVKVHPNPSGWGSTGTKELIEPTPDQDASYIYAKDFTLKGKPVWAQTNICALGYYEMYINGKKAGDHVLDPGFTAFDKRAFYVSYDITSMLKERNRFTVWMGNGLFNSTCIDTWGYHDARWRAMTKFIMLTDIYYADGSHDTVVSDEGFRCHKSFIIHQNIRQGETHNMPAKEYCGEYTGSIRDWNKVYTVPFAHPLIEQQKLPAIKETECIYPVGFAGTPEDLWVRFPVNMTGYAEIRLRGERGRTVSMEFRERGPYDWHGKEVGYEEPHLCAHVQGDFQTLHVVLSGEEDICKPHFSYSGFQYIHVRNLGYIPSLRDFKGIFVHTDLKQSGSFRCSWQRANDLHEIACRTYLNNFHSVPTDCPHREKNGWTADGWMASEYGMLNFDGSTAYAKWLRDMADDQYPDGSMSGIVPNPDWEINKMRLFDTQWTGAVIALLKYYTRYYHDIELVKELWPCLVKYMDYAESKMTDYIYEPESVMALGDWLDIRKDGNTRTDILFCNTVFMYVLAQYMTELAGKAGYDQTRWIELARNIKEAVNEKYLRRDGTYFDSSQTSLVMGILFDLIPENRMKAAEDALIADLKKGINTGLTGIRFLFDCLAKMGRNDIAKQVLDTDAYPSFGFMLRNGATTLWEDWQGYGSHDHPMFGGFDAWLYKYIGGIDYSFGELNVTVPARTMGIEWAETEYESVQGKIGVSYRYFGEALTVKLTVPEGMLCRYTVEDETEYLPAGSYEFEYYSE